MKTILTILTVIWFYTLPQAQPGLGDKTGPNDFSEIINANIPGAPQLGRPMLVMGDSQPVVAKGFGIAAPAYWDWDNDGKKDLLIGEFLSGLENGPHVGNFMRVYKNIGDNTNPKFTDRFNYARPSYTQHNNGTPLSARHS